MEEIGALQEVDRWVFGLSPARRSSKSAALMGGTAVSTDPLCLNERGKQPKFRGTGIPLAVVQTQYPQGSSSCDSELFEPVCCLTDTYISASAAELREGLHRLRQNCVKQGSTKKVLLKDHVSTFIDCFESISRVDALISKNNGGAGITADLSQIVEEVYQSAQALYTPMLERRRECERDRTALAVLNNYKFLFSLPKELMQNAADENWAAVIKGYQRAHSAKAQTSITVFAQILQVIEDIIEGVRDALFKKLEQRGIPYDVQVKLIGYLDEIGSKHDPRWFCARAQKGHVVDALESCVDSMRSSQENARQSNTGSQIGRLDAFKAQVRSARLHSSSSIDTESSAALSSAKLLVSSMRESSNVTSHSLQSKRPSLFSISSVPTNLNPSQLRTVPKSHFCVAFITEMSRVLNEFLPSIWKLGKASLQQHVDGDMGDYDALLKSARTYGDDDDSLLGGDDDSSTTAVAERSLELEALVMEVIDLYCSKVRQIVLSEALDEEKNVQKGYAEESSMPRHVWLPQCDALIRKCLGLMSALGLSEASVSGLVELTRDFQRVTVREVFAEAAASAKALVSEEDWTPLAGGMHTSLPDRFNVIMSACFGAIRDSCAAAADSGPLFDDEEEAEELMCTAFGAFCNTLDRLAYESDASLTTEERHVPAISSKNTNVMDPAGRKSTPFEKRWMLVMSNCLHTRQKIVPTIARKFQSLEIGDLDANFDDVIRMLEELDFRCFESLLNLRAGALSPLVVQCVQEVPQCHKKNGISGHQLHVRTYAREILMNLVLVHADMSAYARPFLKRVVSQLVIRLAKRFFTVLNTYDTLGRDSKSNIPQLQLEIRVMKRILRHYDREPTVWKPVEDLLEVKSPPVKSQQRRALPNPEPSQRKKVLPTPGRSGGRVLPTPGAGKGRVLPKPNSSPAEEEKCNSTAAVDSAVERYLQSSCFQHACFDSIPEDQLEADELYADEEATTMLDADPMDDEDDEDFV